MAPYCRPTAATDLGERQAPRRNRNHSGPARHFRGQVRAPAADPRRRREAPPGRVRAPAVDGTRRTRAAGLPGSGEDPGVRAAAQEPEEPLPVPPSSSSAALPLGVSAEGAAGAARSGSSAKMQARGFQMGPGRRRDADPRSPVSGPARHLPGRVLTWQALRCRSVCWRPPEGHKPAIKTAAQVI